MMFCFYLQIAYLIIQQFTKSSWNVELIKKMSLVTENELAAVWIN